MLHQRIAPGKTSLTSLSRNLTAGLFREQMMRIHAIIARFMLFAPACVAANPRFYTGAGRVRPRREANVILEHFAVSVSADEARTESAAPIVNARRLYLPSPCNAAGPNRRPPGV